jgi:hypothetical protein
MLEKRSLKSSQTPSSRLRSSLKAWLVLPWLVFWPALGLADGSGLQTYLAIDIVGQAGARQKENPPDRLAVREVEVFFFGPIDPIFDGTLGLAAHQEEGKAFVELHEATLGSTKWIPYSRFRLGQYFLGVGKLNATHRHDWPFISAPRVHREFFDEEGVSDTGLEYSVVPPVSFPLDLTLGVTNGWTFGHTHSEGKKPRAPVHYARLSTFFSLPADGGLQIGANYLGRTDSEGLATSLVGLDMTMKWRDGRVLPFFLQSEVWLRELKPREGATSRSLGFYVFPQVHVIQDVHLGLLYDGYTVLNLKDVLGKDVDNYDQGIGPSLTWKPSEFATFRANYTWMLTNPDGKATRLGNSYAEVQTTFILGAHPAHEF